MSFLALSLLSPIGAAAAPAPRADATPIDQRLAAALAQLDTLTTDAMARTGVPGVAVAVVHKGELVYAKGFGVRDVDTGEPVTPDTVFQLASVSKSVGASVVAAAVGRGIVTWQDPVVEHLPWFELSDPYVTTHATIGDMYTMRSGLPGQAGDVLEAVGFNRRQILGRLDELPLAPFRTLHQYTNFGLTVGAEAVAAAADKPWAVLSEELIYRPLGMTSTSSRYADFVARPNRSSLHVPVDGAYASLYRRDADAQSPAGGVSSTVLDLSRWMSMEMAGGWYGGRQVVASKALGKAQTPHSRTSPQTGGAQVPTGYGYGMGVSVSDTGRVHLAHSGAFSAGGGTAYLLIPAEQIGIVVLSNALAGVPEAVYSAFGELVEKGEVSKDWVSFMAPRFQSFYAPDPTFAADEQPVDPEPARPLADYVGTYANGFWGTVSVQSSGGRLSVTVGPDKVVIPLRHWTGDEFVGTFAAGDIPSDIGISFGGPRGKAATLTLGMGVGDAYVLSRLPG